MAVPNLQAFDPSGNINLISQGLGTISSAFQKAASDYISLDAEKQKLKRESDLKEAEKVDIETQTKVWLKAKTDLDMQDYTQSTIIENGMSIGEASPNMSMEKSPLGETALPSRAQKYETQDPQKSAWEEKYLENEKIYGSQLRDPKIPLADKFNALDVLSRVKDKNKKFSTEEGEVINISPMISIQAGANGTYEKYVDGEHDRFRGGIKDKRMTENIQEYIKNTPVDEQTSEGAMRFHMEKTKQNQLDPKSIQFIGASFESLSQKRDQKIKQQEADTNSANSAGNLSAKEEKDRLALQHQAKQDLDAHKDDLSKFNIKMGDIDTFIKSANRKAINEIGEDTYKDIMVQSAKVRLLNKTSMKGTEINRITENLRGNWMDLNDTEKAEIRRLKKTVLKSMLPPTFGKGTQSDPYDLTMLTGNEESTFINKLTPSTNVYFRFDSGDEMTSSLQDYVEAIKKGLVTSKADLSIVNSSRPSSNIEQVNLDDQQWTE